MSASDQALLDTLNAAIASGATSITHNNKTIQYRRFDDMVRARNDLMRRMGLLGSNKGGSVYAPTFGRGYH